MLLFTRVQLRSFEVGLLFRDGDFQRLLSPGRHWLFDPFGRLRVDKASQRDPWLVHEQLDVIAKSGQLAGRAETLELQDRERALVWVDDRFCCVLAPGRHAWWTGQRQVRVERIDAREPQLQHAQLNVITRTPQAQRHLDICRVPREHIGVLYIDGAFVNTLPPGEYAFWKGVAEASVVLADMRETMLDISGQEIMTADKVTLRLNAVVTYRLDDPKLAVGQADLKQALYRESQLAFRGAVGSRDLDGFLADKDALAREVEAALRSRAAELGVKILSAGIRDVILPGEIKDLMNRVTEAKKAAEAQLISRREETAAMRSQANTAKLLADSPVLMRLRELEVLEKIAANGKLNVILGDKGLAEKVVNLL